MSDMEQNRKLYRCYKETCNRCINEELITDSEYQEMLDQDGRIICPEDHEECGIKEIPENEYPKAAKGKSPIIKYIIIGLVIIALIVVAIMVFSGSGDEQNKSKYPNIEEEITDPEKNMDNSTVKLPEGTQTINFDNGSKYVGEVKDGKMDGLGTFYYGVKTQISKRDLKKRFAEQGDYLIGEFKADQVVSGKLYDSEDNLKEVIVIGR